MLMYGAPLKQSIKYNQITFWPVPGTKFKSYEVSYDIFSDKEVFQTRAKALVVIQTLADSTFQVYKLSSLK